MPRPTHQPGDPAVAALVYVLLLVVAAKLGRRRPGWPSGAGACVAWRRRAGGRTRPAPAPATPPLMRAAPPLPASWAATGHPAGIHMCLNGVSPPASGRRRRRLLTSACCPKLLLTSVWIIRCAGPVRYVAGWHGVVA